MKCNKIGIYIKPTKNRQFSKILPHLITWLNKRNKTVFFFTSQAEIVSTILKKTKLNLLSPEDKSEIRSLDLILSMGGDGTLIGATKSLSGISVPILGINLGHLGFITEFNKSQIYDSLEYTFSKKVELIEIPLFKVLVKDHNFKTVFSENFINDAVVHKGQISRLANLFVDGKEENILNIRSDGLIISSPIGSTAYSLAAGGPIVTPFVKAIVLTPICPHSLTHRPLVLPDSETLTIKIPSYEKTMVLTLDGQTIYQLSPYDQILIKKNGNKKVKLIRNPDRTYFQTLSEKFFHGRRES